MIYAFYNTALTIAAPFGAAWLAANPRHRNLLARFAPTTPRLDKRPIWVHACSVGEINTARPILAALRDAWPDTPLVLTVSTDPGYRHASSVASQYHVTWCPFDHPVIVRRFLARLDPAAALLMETEIWPNLIRECERCGIPAALVNGRLSDKHYPRYIRWRGWLQPVLSRLTAACVQNSEYANRFAALGVDATRIHITGNTKFDGVVTTVDGEAISRLRRESGFGPDDPILVFGSVRTGDDGLVAQCWTALRKEFPSLRLVVAPRHIERVQDILSRFDEPILLRSEVVSGKKAGGERVLVVDTLGELVSFYAIATVAVIGGSFFPGVNGHNPLESAALGVPTVFGPFMRNFIDPARVLTDCDGAKQVKSPDALLGVLRELLVNPSQRAAIAKRAIDAIAMNRGAIQRTLNCIAPLLGKQGHPTAS